MAALGTTRRRAFKGQTFIYVVINQPLMVPEVVTAVALLIFFGIVKVATGYQGLGYLIAIDRVLDMMRTMTNVTGQMLVPVLVAKETGLLDREVYESASTNVGLADDAASAP